MTTTGSTYPDPPGVVHDLIGVGFGPGNLGFAAALAEESSGPQIQAVFFERNTAFDWHPGMLLPGANMQISFLKDLVTMRNPESRFSFVKYLKEHGRLTDFINRQTFTPERLEFADYLAWAARSVDADVRYGHSVTSVRQADSSAPPQARFTVHTEGPAGAEVHHARCVLIARGLEERLPDWARREHIQQSGRVFHNHRILNHLEALPDGTVENGRFLVVGGGQSAAEVVSYLHDQGAEVHASFHSYGYTPADSSPFANRVFDPDAVDDFYQAPVSLREELLSRHRYTNYSGVESALLTELYEREYRESVCGEQRLRLHRASDVRDLSLSEAGHVEVLLEDRISGTTHTIPVDAVVCATGFRSRGLCGITELPGSVSVARDYHVTVDGAPIPGLFIQGATEHTHGIGSTLLSNVAVRSGELHEAIQAEILASDRMLVTH